MNEIEKLLNSLSDDVRNLVENNEWENAMKLASLNEQDVVAEIYLRTLCEKGNQWQNIDWNKIDSIKRVLIKWIKELGFREATNPYLQFIRMFYEISENSNTILTENNCIALNNLYADGVLDFSDIAGTGDNGLNHVIFNHNLYGNSMNDLEFIVKAYETLSSKSFVSRLNIGAIKSSFNTNLSNAKRVAIDENNLNINTLRDAIIFKDYTKPQTSEINSKQYIEKLLSIGENTSNDNNNISRVVKDFRSLSSADKRDLLNSILNLSQSELNSLISKLK